MEVSRDLGIADLIGFVATVVIFLGIGVYSAFSGGRQKTTDEFLVGNRKLSTIPVTLSLIVSFESSIMMLGGPAEQYTYGIQYWLINPALCVSMMIVALLMVPTYFHLNLFTAYEYLQVRFNSRGLRLVGSLLAGMSNLWYMGIVLYGPATALQAVFGFEMWYSVVVIAVIAMIYTTIGGIKAVIWADAFQSFIMVAGMLAIIIKGTIDAGGVKNVYDINMRGKRLEMFNFDPNPTTRMTFWSLLVSIVFRAYRLGTNQITVQRIATMSTLKKAKAITLVAGPGLLLFGTLATLKGVVAYAYYTTRECDPLSSGKIDNPNQIIPYLVLDLFHNLPGLTGFYLASLFSASFSTLSSGYAGISAIVWSDVIKPVIPHMKEIKATLITKILVLISCILSIGIAILVMQVGGPMSQIAGTLLAVFDGPLAGLFLLAGLIPKANSKGAFAAVITSGIFGVWKGFGTSFSPDAIKTPYLPGPSIANCSFGNSTYQLDNVVSTIRSIHTTNAESSSLLAIFYSISFLWIGPISMLISLAVGTAVSYATGGRQKQDIDVRFLMPVCDRLFCCLPECIKRLARYNPGHREEEVSEPVIRLNQMGRKSDYIGYRGGKGIYDLIEQHIEDK